MTTADKVLAREPAMPKPPGGVIPERQTDTYEELCAWYSGFAWCEHYRKVVLSQCQEIVRARFAASGEKITESRIESLSRLESGYLGYLARHLEGRILWEKAFLAQGGMR